MSITFSVGKLKAEERRAIVQAIETQMQQVIIDGVTQVLQEFLEQEVTTKLGRAIRSPRQVSSQPHPIDWHCAYCGCNDANQFTRDGHYRRSLETGWGHVQNMQVPMLECQCCGHDVICVYAAFGKNKRFWMDLDQDVLWSTSCCQSVREIAERWSAT